MPFLMRAFAIAMPLLGSGWSAEPAGVHAAIDLGACAVELYPGESRHAVDIAFTIPQGMTFIVGPPGASAWKWLEAEVAGVAPGNPLEAGSRHLLRVYVSTDDQGAQWDGIASVAGTVSRQPASLAVAVTATVADYIDWPHADPGDIGAITAGAPPVTRDTLIRRGRHKQPFDEIRIDSTNLDVLAVALTPIDGNTWRLHETWSAAKVSGIIMLHEQLRFLDHGVPCPYSPSRALRLTVHGPLEASPAAILFGAHEAHVSRERIVHLHGSAEAIAAHSTDPQVSCLLRAGSAGQELVVTFSPQDNPRSRSLSVPGYCEVSMRGGGTLMIPYYASILPQASSLPAAAAPSPDGNGF